MHDLGVLRDGPLEKLWWKEGAGEGGGDATKYKKIFAQGKIEWKKIHARQLTLKNIHAKAQKKKKTYKESNNENKFMRLENFPPPP